MSYEKKMKDLMGRLVSMSPEPPPFPEEEAPMARQHEQRRSRPALVFAAAAALVIVLAVPLLLFRGGEEPPAGTTTTTTVPATTTTDGSTDSTALALPVWSRPVYLYQMPENSFGNNPALVPVWIEVSQLNPDEHFTAALTALGSNLPDTLENAIPADVQIVDLTTTVVDGADVWVADMSESFLDGAGGALADFTMLNQLIYTLTDNEIHSVLFTVGGEPVEAFGSEGLVLIDPVTRESFREGNLGLIFLTKPLVESEDAYVVEGMANVTEATLALEVIDGEGTVVHEEIVMATAGTGTFGEFSARVSADLITPGESSIRLFTHSLEDGSATEIVTIPIPVGDVWPLGVGG